MWSVCSSSRNLPSSPIFAWACANSIDVFYVFKKVLSLNRRASTRQEPMALSNYLWQQECIFSPNTAIANQITPLNHISVSRQLDIFQRTKEIFVTSILNVSRKAHNYSSMLNQSCVNKTPYLAIFRWTFKAKRKLV